MPRTIGTPRTSVASVLWLVFSPVAHPLGIDFVIRFIDLRAPNALKYQEPNTYQRPNLFKCVLLLHLRDQAIERYDVEPLQFWSLLGKEIGEDAQRALNSLRFAGLRIEVGVSFVRSVSGQHTLHDFAMHVGQAIVAALEAERQTLVIEAEQMQ